MTDKILFTIATILICTGGTYAFGKLYIGTSHMHPPDKKDIDHTRKELQKATGMENPPFIRKPQKEQKFEHPKKFRPHIN